MTNKPHSIRKAKIEDLPALLCLYRDVGEDLLSKGNPMWSEGYPNETILSSDIEDGRLYVLFEGKTLLGAASVSHDVAEAFFPQSHSYRKSDDLLERIGYRGEEIAILHRLAISPDRQKEGLGSEFLQSLLARYKGSTWVFCVYEKNESALRFYQKRGFSSLGLYPGLEYGDYSSQYVLYRTYKREGLCSTAWW